MLPRDIFYYTVRHIQGLLALFGNGLTAAVVITCPKMRTSANMFVLSLALCDLFIGLLAPLFLATQLLENQASWETVCLVKEALNFIALMGTVFSTLLISVDRFIYIRFPLRYDELVTFSRAFLMLGVTGVFLLVLTVVIFAVVASAVRGEACDFTTVIGPTVIAFGYIPVFIVVSTLMVALYSYVACVAYRMQKRDAELGFNGCSSQMKFTKTLGLVLGVFYALYIPSLVMSQLTYPDSPDWVHWLYNISLLLFYCNTFVNPIIYAWRMKTFNDSFRQMLSPIVSCLKQDTINNSQSRRLPILKSRVHPEMT